MKFEINSITQSKKFKIIPQTWKQLLGHAIFWFQCLDVIWMFKRLRTSVSAMAIQYFFIPEHMLQWSFHCCCTQILARTFPTPKCQPVHPYQSNSFWKMSTSQFWNSNALYSYRFSKYPYTTEILWSKRPSL